MTTIMTFLNSLPLGVQVAIGGVGMTLFVVFIFCLAVVFSIASPEFVPNPVEDQLVRTDRIWLAIISPFHVLSDEKYEALEKAGANSLWTAQVRAFLGMAAIIVLQLAALIPSIVGGALYLTACIVGEACASSVARICGLLTSLKR